MNGHKGVILFFRDGTVFDTFLIIDRKRFKKGHRYWRHYHHLKNDNTTNIETIKAYYKRKYELWEKRVNETFDLKETKTLHI